MSRAPPRTVPSAVSSARTGAVAAGSITSWWVRSALRRRRTATRMRCTASCSSARTCGSAATRSRTPRARIARATSDAGLSLVRVAGSGRAGPVGASRPSASAPSARASFEALSDGRAPASTTCRSIRSRSAVRCFRFAGASGSSSTSHSCQARTVPPRTSDPVTRSSANSATARPSSSSSVTVVRTVSRRASGVSSRPRTCTATWSSTAGGIAPSPSSPSWSGQPSSVRPSPPSAGSFTCQPASCPPSRRRRIMRRSASTWSAVSR
ncbi:hypothetical protein CMMCAS04_04950 [Clavibacter michiganensis subsp. michiganensis]|nr:hypothetical protein CMMCAS04_04950 [Clavibacter michiganensis subsp. michiganensis]